MERQEEFIKTNNDFILNERHFITKIEKQVTKDLEAIKIKNDYVKQFMITKENKIIMLSKSKLDSARKHAEELRDDYDRLRKTTVPYNYLWYWFIKRKVYKDLPLSMQRGVHFIVALMGGGKSSFIYHTIERLRATFGYGAYVNVDLEFPHWDPVLNDWVTHNMRIDESDFWGPIENEETGKIEFKQLKRFNGLFPILVLDEWLSKMNHRMNNTSSYKEMFIPFVRSLTHMRHQGIHHVYVASQLDSTDIQLMGLFKYLHEVEIDLDISYWDWVETGKLEKHVKGWMVFTYEIKRKKGKPDKVLKKSWYEPKIMDMTNFNSLNQASEYSDLPYHKVDVKRSYA